MKDAPLKQMIVEMLTRVRQDDPARGDWCVAEGKINSWVDASFLAMGVVLENRGTILEDEFWFRSINDAQHINLARLDVTMKDQALKRRTKRWCTSTLTQHMRVSVAKPK